MLKNKIIKIQQYLNSVLIERKEAINVCLIALFCSENVFLIGKAGIAKTKLAEELVNVCKKNTTCFKFLMNKFTTPDELFGSVDILKLKEGKFERNLKNYMIDSDIVFLDEIWKSGSAIQNSLLRVLNEKKFNNGGIDVDSKMKFMISASNELPEENQGLEPLWDRFIFRLILTPINEKENFFNMVLERNEKVILKESDLIDLDEIKNYQKEIDKVKIDDVVLDFLWEFKTKYISQFNQDINNVAIFVSDRKWKKIIKIVKTVAFLNQRNYVVLTDLFVLGYLLWDKISQINPTKRLVLNSIVDYTDKIIGYKNYINEFNLIVKNIVEDLIKNEYTYKNVNFINGVYKSFYLKENNKYTQYYFSENNPNKILGKTNKGENEERFENNSVGILVRENNIRKLNLYLQKHLYKNFDVIETQQELIDKENGIVFINDTKSDLKAFVKNDIKKINLHKQKLNDFIFNLESYIQKLNTEILKEYQQENILVVNNIINKTVDKKIQKRINELNKIKDVYCKELIKLFSLIEKEIPNDTELYEVLKPYFIQPENVIISIDGDVYSNADKYIKEQVELKQQQDEIALQLKIEEEKKTHNRQQIYTMSMSKENEKDKKKGIVKTM